MEEDSAVSATSLMAPALTADEIAQAQAALGIKPSTQRQPVDEVATPVPAPAEPARVVPATNLTWSEFASRRGLKAPDVAVTNDTAPAQVNPPLLSLIEGNGPFGLTRVDDSGLTSTVDDKVDIAPAAVPPLAAFHSNAGNGTKQGQLCNRENITHPVANGVLDKLAQSMDKLPEQFTEAKPSSEAIQRARRSEAVRRARANDRKREAERKADWKAVAKASGNKTLFITNQQMLGMFRDYFDALAAGAPVSASSVIQSWFPDKHETVRGKNWLREPIQTALTQLQYHPVAIAIKECEMFGAVEYRQAANLDRIGLCMARVRRMHRASAKLKQQDNDIAELKAHAIASDAEIAELKARLAALEASCVPSGKSGTERDNSKAADRAAVKARVIELVKQGVPYSAIAKQEGVGTGTISRWVNVH